MAKRWLWLWCALLPPLAGAADIDAFFRLALAQAQLAENSSSLAVTQVHLHKAINCLVGDQGAAYYAKAGNPCASLGAGVMTRINEAQAAPLYDALLHANRGVGVSDLPQAQAEAKGMAEALAKLLDSA